MNNLWRNKYILVLNCIKIDKGIQNDFGDFNSHLLIKNFAGGEIFYFSDSIKRIGIKNTEEKIKQIIKENNISLVFFAPHGDNYELSIEFFKRLKDELKVKNVLWVFDDEMIFDILTKYYAQVFDVVVTTDYYATFAYKKLGVPALHFFSSYSKEDFYPVNVSKDIDVSFVGDCTKSDRFKYINYLKGNGIDIKTFGKGSKNGFLKKEDLSKIFSRSKINLNFTKCNRPRDSAWFLYDNNLVSIVRQNKGRPMEVAMTNSFCLSEYAPSLGYTFEIGKAIDVFYDKEDLLKKARYYLENHDIRTQMASSAYKKAITLYEADIFIPRLMEELCKILDNHRYARRGKVIYKDNIFKKNHIIRLTIILFYQLATFRFIPALETFTNLFQYGVSVFFVSFIKGVEVSLVKTFSKILKSLERMKQILL